MSRLSILVIFLPFVLYLNVFPQPANIYTFNPDVRITDATFGDGTSSFFFSQGQHFTAFRGDTVYVVWWESRLSNPPTGNHVFFAKSTDGGATFGPSKRVNDLAAGFYPSMRVDSNGNIYVAYWRQGKIYFTKSTDGGLSFSPSVLVVDSGGAMSNQAAPSIAVNNNGQVFIAWSDERTGSSTIFTAASYDGGQSFGPNVQVDPGAGFTQDIGADENGRVYVAYEGSLGGYDGIIVATSSDSGQSFTSFAHANQEHLPVGYPSLAISKDDQIGVAYEMVLSYGQIRFSVSYDFGQTFSPSVRVDTGYSESDCLGGGRHSASTSNGLFYVAWCDGRERPSDSNCVVNIFLSYSADGGRSFATELGADTSGRSYAFTLRPSMAVNGEGKVFAAWVDTREDPVFGENQYVYGATATPHYVKGDLNLDSLLTTADVVMEINAVYLTQPYPAPFGSADVNCDSRLTAADVVLHLNATYLAEPFPCI